ncbi:hypothetical protein EXIGLDRAFT_841948 [Exidia glandulosa HHB12029]|uniref:Zn(2)-C6 fungal-type domain-containing protein n=1 Tax=Exidia glandulosa HHB12029 TaxID=1314781 RepID=A0A165DKN5_EXIGL|nr:hypothetical protein EXIGLDRAFT_841948 [Exidia glandulosa HHB12029]
MDSRTSTGAHHADAAGDMPCNKACSNCAKLKLACPGPPGKRCSRCGPNVKCEYPLRKRPIKFSDLEDQLSAMRSEIAQLRDEVAHQKQDITLQGEVISRLKDQLAQSQSNAQMNLRTSFTAATASEAISPGLPAPSVRGTQYRGELESDVFLDFMLGIGALTDVSHGGPHGVAKGSHNSPTTMVSSLTDEHWNSMAASTNTLGTTVPPSSSSPSRSSTVPLSSANYTYAETMRGAQQWPGYAPLSSTASRAEVAFASSSDESHGGTGTSAPSSHDNVKHEYATTFQDRFGHPPFSNAGINESYILSSHVNDYFASDAHASDLDMCVLC